MQKKFSRKSIKEFRVLRYSDNRFIENKIPVVREREYKIFINGEKLTTVMLLPSNEIEFIYGFLFTSSFVDSIEDIVSCRICDNYNYHIYLRNNKNLTHQNNLRISNNSEVKYLNENNNFVSFDSNNSINPLQITKLYQKINNISNTYSLNNSVNVCIFYKSEDDFIISEDINRGNALDKIIGYKLLHNIDNDGIIVTTGKITGEIVYKCVKAKLALVATSRAVSSMAIELASKFNITLIGFVNDKSFIVFVDKAKRIINEI